MAEQELEAYINTTAGDETNNEDAVPRDDDKSSDDADNLYRDPNKPVIVGVQMFFSRTEALDMVQQNFFTQFDLVLEWQVCKSTHHE